MTWVMRDWVYLHIPKCGGHSVMSYFPGTVYDETWLHQFRSEIKTSYPIWTTVRHPADRIVSYWIYLQYRLKNGPELQQHILDRLPDDMTDLERFIIEFDEPCMVDYCYPGVDNVVHLEHINKLYPDFPIRNKINRKETWFYLQNNNIMDLIKEKYRADYEEFGYSQHI